MTPAQPTIHRVGVGDLAVVKAAGGAITTHALGSCIGVTVFDPVAGVAGMLHFMLPNPSSEEQAAEKPDAMFGSKGIPRLFRDAYQLGATKENLIVCVAGGAEFMQDDSTFQIGRRNRMIARKLFWKNDIVVVAEETGGNVARTMSVSLEDGTVTLLSQGKERALWTPSMT